ncbi:hypothetical protein GCM10010276_71000 [Streptomyces longisporus]|uniref:Uncharacterized protein n=1 Tax=Streptomyces longisporus TaxID=1948 RepID=A0ABN3N2V4_STRLO
MLCRAPGDAVLACLRDLDVLDKPLDACVGIAPDVALLVQHGTVVGWSLTECPGLVTPPLVDDVVDGEPVALARLRAADEALRAQHEDRHRADTLLDLIATYVEDYGT